MARAHRTAAAARANGTPRTCSPDGSTSTCYVCEIPAGGALAPQRQLFEKMILGVSLLMLMAKSRHKKPENVRRYLGPSPEAIAELTSLLAFGDVGR